MAGNAIGRNPIIVELGIAKASRSGPTGAEGPSAGPTVGEGRRAGRALVTALGADR